MCVFRPGKWSCALYGEMNTSYKHCVISLIKRKYVKRLNKKISPPGMVGSLPKLTAYL